MPLPVKEERLSTGVRVDVVKFEKAVVSCSGELVKVGASDDHGVDRACMEPFRTPGRLEVGDAPHFDRLVSAGGQQVVSMDHSMVNGALMDGNRQRKVDGGLDGKVTILTATEDCLLFLVPQGPVAASFVGLVPHAVLPLIIDYGPATGSPRDECPIGVRRHVPHLSVRCLARPCQGRLVTIQRPRPNGPCTISHEQHPIRSFV